MLRFVKAHKNFLSLQLLEEKIEISGTRDKTEVGESAMSGVLLEKWRKSLKGLMKRLL